MGRRWERMSAEMYVESILRGAGLTDETASSNYERALERYVRSSAPREFAGHVLSDFHVTHEDGWTSDAGTGWPAETNIEFMDTTPGARGQRYRRKRVVGIREYGFDDFLRAILNDADPLSWGAEGSD